MKYFKTEIIISNIFLQELVLLLEEIKIQGYTALEIARGKGIRRGEQLSESLLPFSRSSLVFVVSSKTQSETIVKTLQPYLDDWGGAIISYPVHYASGLS